MAEDPRLFLHFKTLAKFQAKLADGTINPDKHFVVIKDEKLIWVRGIYYSDNSKLDNIQNLYNDWEISQSNANTITITLKGKSWNASTRKWEDISKALTLESATGTVAGLMSALDKRQVDLIDTANFKLEDPTTTASSVTINASYTDVNNEVKNQTISKTLNSASSTNAGILTAEDKRQLDIINTANFALETPTATATTVVLHTSKTDVNGETTNIKDSETTASRTIPAATSSTAGVMTADDKKKLNSITYTDGDTNTTAGISEINFSAGVSDTTKIITDNSNDVTNLIIEFKDNFGSSSDSFQIRGSNGTVEASDNVRFKVGQNVQAINKNGTALERVITVSELEELINKIIVAGKTSTDAANTELAKLGTNYSTLLALAKTVKTFLEDKDATDSAINKWQEIENFLAGVTDSQTLLGIVNDSINALDVSDTAVSGQYVNKVSETNGKISVSRSNISAAPLNNYSKGTSSADVVATDSINTAISKLENKISNLDASSSNAIKALDKSDSVVSNQFVTAVSQTDGLISVSRARPTASNISNTAITASTSQVGISGTDLLTALSNVATAIKSEETARTSADSTLTTNLSSEISRAKSAEQANTSAISTETSRAKSAESTISTNLSSHTSNTSNPHSVTKSQVGLGNVTNDSLVKRSEMGVASGVATLDTSGKVPSSQLPSYVDDVIEATSKSNFPTTGETGKIYVDTSTNKTYRWSGTAYVEISASLALGETSSTAYAGDKGAATTSNLNTHTSNSTIHITSAERTAWNAKTSNTGTVTSVKATGNDNITVSGSPITTSGTLTLGVASGYSIPSTSQQSTWSSKQDAISDLSTIRSNASAAIKTISAVAGSNINSVGTPSVTASTSNNATTLTFNYLKGAKGDTGAKGDKGDTGAAGKDGADGTTPSITMTASVSNTVGTPSVTVTKGGTTAAPTFNLAFSNLKGESTGSAYTLPAATSSSLGGIKTGYTTSGKNYKVQLDSSNNAYVNVPWTDTNTTYSTATTSAAGLMSSSDKTKLDNIASGAQVNQNAFSNVVVGSTTVAADSTTDTLTLAAGSNITLTPDATNDKITISATDTVYTHPTGSAASKSSGFYKFSTDATSHVSGVTTVALSDLTNLGAAPKASPAFTGTPTAPTAATGTNSTQLATTAFVTTAINNSFAANDAMIFKGTIGTSGTVTALPATHNAGWTYKVITAGTYAGVACEIGDMIICITDGTTSTNSHWTVVQSNIDGAVTGPTSATDSRVAVFNGTTGKVIKDSGYTIATSVPSGAVFTDTHYTTHLYAGSGSAANASTTNGNTKISIADNSTVRNSITLKGSGATTVTSDASGNITISSTDNNTTYGIATMSTAGLIKPVQSYNNPANLIVSNSSFDSSTQAPVVQPCTTTSGRYYAVEMDSNGVPFVNVPWANSTSISWSNVTNKKIYGASDNVSSGYYYSGLVPAFDEDVWLENNERYTPYLASTGEWTRMDNIYMGTIYVDQIALYDLNGDPSPHATFTTDGGIEHLLQRKRTYIDPNDDFTGTVATWDPDTHNDVFFGIMTVSFLKNSRWYESSFHFNNVHLNKLCAVVLPFDDGNGYDAEFQFTPYLVSSGGVGINYYYTISDSEYDGSSNIRADVEIFY